MAMAAATVNATAVAPKASAIASSAAAKSPAMASAAAAASALPPTSLPAPPSPYPPSPPPTLPSPGPPAARRRPPGRASASAAASAADPLSDKATILLIRRTLCADDNVLPVVSSGGHSQSSAQAAATAAAATLQIPAQTAGPTAPSQTTTTPASDLPPPSSLPLSPPLPPPPPPPPSSSSSLPSPQTTPIEELLPPLTSRNDVDLQLYALLAVVVREFVLTWYGRITTDGQLATEIVHIFAHCTRALEQRLRKADLESLVFDELPALLDNHVQAYRISHQQRLVPQPVQTDPRAIYHALLPLPALSPVPSPFVPKSEADQAANESAYRQLLVSGLLAVLLPTEDLENECLTSLLGQILSELLVGGVLAGRVAEPWMMWEIVGMLARLVREKIDGVDGNASDGSGNKMPPKMTSQTSQTPGPISSDSTSSPSSLSQRLASTVAPLFWSALRIGFAVFASLRFLSASIGLARSLPPRRLQPTEKTLMAESSLLAHPPLPSPPSPSPAPVLAYRLWPTIASIVELDFRMPWLSGCLSMFQWLALTGPGRIGAFDGPLDRLLSHYLRKYALDAALLPTLLRSLRANVFPGNKFGATPPTLVAPANPQAEKALRRRTAEAVWAMVNGDRAASDATLADIDGVLDVFSDAYCNKHLLYGLLEAVLVCLLPELAQTGVLGLWEERLS